MSEKLKYIDLFAGCGGLSDGFEQTGKYKFVAGVEWEKAAHATFIKRYETKWGYKDCKERMLRFDIQSEDKLIYGWENHSIYGNSRGFSNVLKKGENIDLIIGGPPCQAYSVAGRIRDKYAMHYDYRNYLFESYLKIVERYKPTLFVFENVPGLLSAAPGGGLIVEKVCAAFNKAGYEISKDFRNETVCDFSDFGVPQYRSRVIIVGLNKKRFGRKSGLLLKNFYKEMLPSYKVKKKFSVEEAISDLMPFYPADNIYTVQGKNFSHTPSQDTFQGHIPRFHNTRDVKIFRELAEDVQNGSLRYKSAEDLKKLYTKMTGKISNIHKYYVLRWQEPSNTIPAHLHKDGLRHIHPDPKQARSITVREAARLQTFPDDFIFLGSSGDQYKMIGNAVSPKFAEALARAIYDLLRTQNV